MAVEVPRWRIVNNEDLVDDNYKNDEELVLDDMSERAFIKRHKEPERREKRGLRYLGVQKQDKIKTAARNPAKNQQSKKSAKCLKKQGETQLKKIKKQLKKQDKTELNVVPLLQQKQSTAEPFVHPVIKKSDQKEEKVNNFNEKDRPRGPSIIIPLARGSAPITPMANQESEKPEEYDPTWLAWMQSPTVIITHEPFTMPYYATYY